MKDPTKERGRENSQEDERGNARLLDVQQGQRTNPQSGASQRLQQRCLLEGEIDRICAVSRYSEEIFRQFGEDSKADFVINTQTTKKDKIIIHSGGGRCAGKEE